MFTKAQAESHLALPYIHYVNFSKLLIIKPSFLT